MYESLDSISNMGVGGEPEDNSMEVILVMFADVALIPKAKYLV